MAVRRTAKKRQDTIILPPVTSNFAQSRENAGKTLGNFGTYVLLPSLDPVQKLHAFYDVKRFCKLLCEWYASWKVWQREVLLCSLSDKCSVNLLTSLCTILEPVFHRDFVSRLRGKYPNIKAKTAKILQNQKSLHQSRRNTKGGTASCQSKGKENDAKKDEVEKTLDGLYNIDKISIGINTNLKSANMNQLIKNEIGISTEQWEKSIDSSVQEIQDQSCMNQRASLTDLIEESLLKCNNELEHVSIYQVQAARSKHTDQTMAPDIRDVFKCRSNHVHMANIYKRDTAKRFFSASRFERLSDMKASPSRIARSDLGPCVSELDQKCFKHRRWWSSDPKNRGLIPARGLNLWKHFTRQLNEANKKMDFWGDHQKVTLISEVIKISDPEQISFFAQCLIQRLKDHTDMSILPDHTLLQIFSNLDAPTLGRLSQVSKRWRYLTEDNGLWKNKCSQLGLSSGVINLTNLIEKSANNHSVDWKQAYQEVRGLFREPRVWESHQKPEMQGLASDSSLDTQGQHLSSGTKDTSLMTVTTDVPFEQFGLNLTPEVESLLETADNDEINADDVDDDEDLTGGNLAMLEDVLSEFSDEKIEEDDEEIAYDIRPDKIQALNEMENLEDEPHQLVTVGVEDVKSVKRVRKIKGHLDGVFAVQFDAKRCLTGSADRLLKMWDVRSGREIKTMYGHLGGVRCLQFDNEKILSGSWDTTIMIWDIVKFTCIGVLRGHVGCISCLRFNSNFIVSGSHDMTVRVWDVDTWECLHVLKGHEGEVTCLFLGGIYLLTGSTDMTVKLWRLTTGELLKTLVGHESSVLSVQACRALVLSGSEEGKIIFWDIEHGSSMAIIQAHTGPCNCLFVWRSHFLSGGRDGLVKQWDISTMTCLRTLQGHKGPVHCVQMSWSKIISSSEDGTVRIWDLESPVHKLNRQFDENENVLLPFDTIDQQKEDGSRRKSKESGEIVSKTQERLVT